ncbi:BnaCnng27020D [Brassica napus]|uniref:BnaCnng27020D protein n=1 Tax=Brassica napus TaxID=3708 RepID=A0A078IYS5_BRANA|nr:BnaCnng27020D [Brassica napus]
MKFDPIGLRLFVPPPAPPIVPPSVPASESVELIR